MITASVGRPPAYLKLTFDVPCGVNQSQDDKFSTFQTSSLISVDSNNARPIPQHELVQFRSWPVAIQELGDFPFANEDK